VSGPAPARPPTRVVLEGRYARLEPIGPQHAESLFAATDDATGSRYRWLSTLPPASVAEMREALAAALARTDRLTFAVLDRATGAACGQQSLMRIEPAHGCIEIGAVLWGRGAARTRIATEAVRLFAGHVFDTLGYRRFEWKCDSRNDASQAAARRFGFSYEGLFRQHMIVKGASRDTAWFAMLDGDWPRLRAEYDRWLAPANFTADGTQKTPLRFG